VLTTAALLTLDSYPKIEFYHTDGVRTMMVDILFIYAKLKPETSYRQVYYWAKFDKWLLFHFLS